MHVKIADVKYYELLLANHPRTFISKVEFTAVQYCHNYQMCQFEYHSGMPHYIMPYYINGNTGSTRSCGMPILNFTSVPLCVYVRVLLGI